MFRKRKHIDRPDAFHGGLDNGKLDRKDWTKESITDALTDIIEKTDGGKGLIPGFTMGGPGSTFPGVYEWASGEIDRLSRVYFQQDLHPQILTNGTE